MLIEWLGTVKSAGNLLVDAKSLYDSVRGKQPTADFQPGQYGPPILCVKNTRAETIIVEDVQADPILLVFAAGDDDESMLQSMLRPLGHEGPLCTLKPNEEIQLRVFASLGQEKAEEKFMRVFVFQPFSTDASAIFPA